jgi:hypothetical protein
VESVIAAIRQIVSELAIAQAGEDSVPAHRPSDLTWAQWRREVEPRGSSS